MAVTNTSSQFRGDVVNYIEKKTLPLTRRQLVAYQFANKVNLPDGFGNTWTATRYNRLPLPSAPLAEGVPPNGETMTVGQVTGVVQQWGDAVTITDVAEMQIFHPLFKEATKLVALQIAETDERQSYLTLGGGTQVNFVNQRGSRAALVAGDVLDPHTVNRTVAALATIGAPRFNGDEETDEMVDIKSGGARASENPRTHSHYVAVCHPLVAADFSESPTVQTAWSYSDINRLYNFEVGEWRGVTFCESNMVPFWTGVAAVNGGTATTGGALAVSTTYYLQVTGQNNTNQYESYICQVDSAVTTSGTQNAITYVLPSTPGYLYSVYIGTSAAGISSLALTSSTAAPQSGPYTGVATQIAPGTTILLTGIGPQQVPPQAPATGLSVYPTFVFGRDYYSMISLSGLEMFYLKNADKADILNQKRVIGWKKFWGMVITNQQFGARIEGVSNFTATFG
jgi:N4-gp56 family major capsid protein